MTYEQAREEIAEIIYVGLYPTGHWGKLLTKGQFLDIAHQILPRLFTPEQIEEWKKGGYPAIVCKDQSLPKPNLDIHIWRDYSRDMAYKEAQQDMTDFRRVKGAEQLQSGGKVE